MNSSYIEKFIVLAALTGPQNTTTKTPNDDAQANTPKVFRRIQHDPGYSKQAEGDSAYSKTAEGRCSKQKKERWLDNVFSISAVPGDNILL